MAIPVLGAAIGAAGATIVDYAMGRPLNLWGKQIEVSQAPGVRGDAYAANFAYPNILPPPDAVIEAVRRGYINTTAAVHALANQGVLWWPEGRTFASVPGLATGMSSVRRSSYAWIWEQVGKMRRSRPDPATWARAWVSGRISDVAYNAAKDGYDADWGAMERAVWAQYQSPGLADLLQLRRLDKISQADFDQGCRLLGWVSSQQVERQARVTPLPSLSVLMRDRLMGLLDNETYSRYANALGHVDPAVRARIESSYFQIPSGPELVQLAVRDAWDEDVVRRWGYDAEFPAPMEYWMRAQGWDWGRTFTGSDGRRYPSVKWPKLFWRAHWQVISPGQAYQAFRRLRPERIARYAGQFPGLTPFTGADLSTVLRVHDYPPAARLWLGALQSQPLRMLTIRQSYLQRVRDRAWAMAQLQDIGYLPDDAATVLDLADNSEAWRDRQALFAQARRLNAQTAREVVAGYADGLVPRETAVTRLSQLGWGAVMVSQALNLAESQVLRQTVRQVVTQVRRSYLSGALSAAEVLAALAQIQIAEPRRSQLLQRWTLQLSLERRQLATAQVTGLVAAGALAPADAVVRLTNLHWTAPDAALLMKQAEQRLVTNQARAAAKQVALAQKNQKALVAAAKAAESAARQARNQLRQITPLATLKRWYCLGIRKGPWIAARMGLMGYDTTSIDTYLLQWAEECTAAPPVEAPAVHQLQLLLKRQTPLATLKKWYQRGIATKSWIIRRMNDAGYTPESIAGYQAEWDATLPKGATGPAPEGSPFPAGQPAGSGP